MPRRWGWFSDPSCPRRAAAVAVLLVVSATVLRAAARVVDFPADFNGAQSAGAEWLAEHAGRWPAWRRAATRDLTRFVPAYVVYGAAVLAWAVPGRRVRAWATGSLVASGAADVVETLLFRGTLDRLLAGAGAADLATRTAVTRAATGAKYAGLVAVAAALALVVAGRAEGRPGR